MPALAIVTLKIKENKQQKLAKWTASGFALGAHAAVLQSDPAVSFARFSHKKLLIKWSAATQ